MTQAKGQFVRVGSDGFGFEVNQQGRSLDIGAMLAPATGAFVYSTVYVVTANSIYSIDLPSGEMTKVVADPSLEEPPIVLARGSRSGVVLEVGKPFAMNLQNGGSITTSRVKSVLAVGTERCSARELKDFPYTEVGDVIAARINQRHIETTRPRTQRNEEDISVERVVDRVESTFVPLWDSDTSSGYKLHVYCESPEDVSLVVSAISPVVQKHRMAGKIMTKAGMERLRNNETQAHKGVTIYLPHASSVDRDAAAIVEALAGYRHEKDIPGDDYLANGVSWRYELDAAVDHTVSLEEYFDRYVSAGESMAEVTPINLARGNRELAQQRQTQCLLWDNNQGVHSAVGLS